MSELNLRVILVVVLLNYSVAENISPNGNNTFVMKIRKKVSNITNAEENVTDTGNLRKSNSGNLKVVEPPDPYDFIGLPEELRVVKNAVKNVRNKGCARDIATVLEDLSKGEKWALQMVDASPKFPVGLLYGSFYQLGNFDECIDVTQPYPLDSLEPVKGQYCLAEIERIPGSENLFNNRNEPNRTIYWGICVPSSCKPEDAAVIVEEIYKTGVKNGLVDVKVQNKNCSYKKEISLSTLDIIYGFIIGAFLIFVIFSTICHYWHIREENKRLIYSLGNNKIMNTGVLKEVLFSFSMINTVKKFLNCKSTDLNLECIYGVKVLSMAFIISGHSLLFVAAGPVLNTKFYEKQITGVENGIFVNNPLLVDTFLLISGFLMARLLLLEMDKRGKINPLFLYIARYIRLTPSYLVVIGFYCTFLIYIGNGPFWQSRIGLERERCLNSWWVNLLYINNYYNTDELCMFQSWYLAVDYHLFIIAPFIIYILWQWKRIGKIVLSVCTVAMIIVPFWLTFKENLDPTLMIYAPEVADISTNYYFKTSYIKTHMRGSSYCIGLFFGYMIHRIQKNGTKIPRPAVWIGWIISILFGILSMFSIIVFYQPYHIQNNIESASYASLHRVAWSLSIGWVIFACVTENGRLVNKLLSWKVFVPLSRLTYCAYLVNGFVEIYNLGTLMTPVYQSKYELARKVTADLGITFTAAFFLCILFESPIHGLEKILLNHFGKKRKTQNDSPSTETIEA